MCLYRKETIAIQRIKRIESKRINKKELKKRDLLKKVNKQNSSRANGL